MPPVACYICTGFAALGYSMNLHSRVQYWAVIQQQGAPDHARHALWLSSRLPSLHASGAHQCRAECCAVQNFKVDFNFSRISRLMDNL